MANRRHRRKQPRRKPPQGDRYRPMTTGPPRFGKPTEESAVGSDDDVVDGLVATYRSFTSEVVGGRKSLASELWAATAYSSARPRSSALPWARDGDDDGPPPEMWRDIAAALAGRPRADFEAAAMLAGLAAALPELEGMPVREEWSRRQQAPLPAWLAAIGAGVATEALVVDHVQGDGVNVMIDYWHPVEPHTLAVYVDHNLGGLAKDVLIGPPLAEAAATFPTDREHGFVHAPISLADARAQIEAALDLTDHTLSPPVDEDLIAYRSLLDRRVADLPSGGQRPQIAELPEAERAALLDGFLDSPEAAAGAPTETHPDAPAIVEVWIDHAAGYRGGDPLRVSAVLAELFLVDYVPRKVMAGDDFVAQVPDVVRAWLRFAARRSDLAPQWLADALAAVDRYAPEMAERASDLGSFGLSKGLLTSGDLDFADMGATGDIDDLDPDAVAVFGADGVMSLAEADPDGDAIRVDLRGVSAEVLVRVSVILRGAVNEAGNHLGTLYGQAAAILAAELGRLDPSPLPNTQDRSWVGGIVWLLAEENDLFRRIECDFSRKLLAERLGMSAQTYAKKAALLRERLGIIPGDPRTWVDIDGDDHYW